ncbi:Ig-like domain-containing protein [Tsukamurella sp. 8F]|uniref:L,D-transpeptidase n=1 Tax=unclassified Tsukamurella TaxID=2633480 RepID=UPI0023B9D671|nr:MULTISPECIES: Ig-like domain-containing protein [unclassified Tsukamurella]MDF0528322.1 Ig-like domain-containing protein [Tsukamurella sp. 8J]MDF0586147.1 Ig-like domain-containing protein [Tsukamurella sp. 8F]
MQQHSPAEVGRRTVLAALAAAAGGISLLAACGKDGFSKKEPTKPAATFVFIPADGAKAPSPTAEISVAVKNGTFSPGVKLTNASSGKQVALRGSADKTKYTVDEPLGYGVKYQWSGQAAGTDGKTVTLDHSFTTYQPTGTVSAVINIADGQEVGIAASLMLQFDQSIEDKAAVEKALTITAEPATEGAWAWLPDDNGSRVHWRPKEYWQPGTKVSMTGKLYGLDYGNDAFGDSDVTSNFVIGRSQIVKADAPSHEIVVMRGDQVYQRFPCSYGEGDLARNITRTGVHVVSEKHEDFYMSNPAAGYFNVHERFAVRISNNGEFIHANPNTIGDQGNSNVTNGCINLSLDNAQAYFQGAVYGDPVEVTGTSIPLSSADGDIYDWTIDWPTWLSMSALKK